MPKEDGAKIPAWFAWRLEGATGLASSCTVLPDEEARKEHARAWAELPPPVAEVVDLREVDHTAGSLALSQLPMAGNAEVVVTYGDDPGHAVAMTWAVFSEFWDDVWHPSSDDIRVAGRDGGLIVEIDHEEQLRVISRQDVGAHALLLDWERSTVALRRLHASPHQFGYEPAGSRYEDLLRVAQRWCAYALLVMQDFQWTSNALAAIEQLRPWHAADLSSLEWPGTKASNAAKVMVFRFEAGSAGVLGRLARRLYQWEQPNLPEDLCLFRPTGEPWLVSIAHEGDGWVNVTRDELAAVTEAIAPLPLKPSP